MSRPLLVLTIASLLCAPLALAPGSAHARSSDEDAMRAGQIQVQAKEAWEAGKDEDALRLANRAISLDPGATTWLAQQIRIEVLEQAGKLEEAMGHVRTYLRVDGLFPEHKAWGDEARERISARLGAAQGVARAAQTRVGLGVGLAVGGAVPLGLGIGWLANYGDKTGSKGLPQEQYLGFLDGGIAMVAVGGVLEGVGIALIASGAGKTAIARGPTVTPTFALRPDGDGWSLGVVGRW